MTLENKLNIKNELELTEVEEKISKRKAKELFESDILDTFEIGLFDTLATIHRALFEDIYDFAGKIRTVNISKGNFRFAPVTYLEVAIKNIEIMKQDTFDEIIEKYIEMNVAHPFKDGNGRSMRIWLDLMLKKQLGFVIDWTAINKDDYMMAIEISHVEDVEIKLLLKNALSTEINNADVFMKGLDASYMYEGYTLYKTQDL